MPPAPVYRNTPTLSGSTCLKCSRLRVLAGALGETHIQEHISMCVCACVHARVSTHAGCILRSGIWPKV